jgi:hypothetical protein
MLLENGASLEKALAYRDVFKDPKYGALIKTIQQEIGTTTDSTLSTEDAPSVKR